ncbi:unnamed protein product [Peniophora sp. CBMAI 1063]|nr:unnamed protein product [Peniophora sp. CBMAI 1063]
MSVVYKWCFRAPAKALVTGANGFVGAWVVRTLLEQGYSVVGVVRAASKGDHLKRMFSSYGDKFTIALVEDITKPGAFDDVVKDVQLIEHVACPVHTNFKLPNELIDPAVLGTTGILQSALRHGSLVRRVVITSSTAAVIRPVSEHTVFNEACYNDAAIAEVEAKGADSPQMSVYCAAKTLAEKAAMKLVGENKPAWDLVIVAPPWVFGPPIHEVPSLNSLNASIQYLYNILVKGDMDASALASQGGGWIDVRDLALAHVLAAQKAEAGGNRFILGAGHYFLQDIVDAAVDNGDSPTVKGEYGATAGKVPLMEFDASKAKSSFGIEYRSLQSMTRDLMAYFKDFSA